MKLIIFTISLYLLQASLCGSVLSQTDPCPDPKSYIMYGWTFQASAGLAAWTGDTGKASQAGLAMQLQTGYDLASWLSWVVSWSSSIHATDQDHPPASGTFATHGMHTAIRLGLPLGRFDISLLGGLGFLWSRPDIIVRIPEFDSKIDLGWIGGLRFIWHTPRRRLWLGVQASAMGSDGIKDMWIIGSGLIGVTL